jgi:hypothetical protein
MSDELFENPNPLKDENLPDFVQTEEEAPAADQPEPEAPPVKKPDPALTGEPMAGIQEEEEAPEEPPVKSYAGKYKTVDDLEKGYRELRDLQRRTAERAKGYEQRTQEIEAKAGELENALRQAIPYLQRASTQRQAPPPDQFGLEDERPTPQPVGPSPDQVAQLADRIAQQRIYDFQQQQMAQVQASQQVQQASQAMEQFFQSHPEIEKESDADSDIAETIMTLNEAWKDTGSILELGNQESLEIALEATQRPALRSVLELHPEYIDTDEGLALARAAANQIDGGVQAPTQGRTKGIASNTPVVERGQTQTPPSGPLNEWEQAVQEYRNSRSRNSDSVFFE